MPALVPDPVPLPSGSRIVACLALSGGGARGLFTALVLRDLDLLAGGPTAERFDLLAGTSIGGIAAIGVAAGIPAADVAAAIRGHAPAIFRRRWWRRALFASRYRQEPLRAAIEAILESHCGMLLSELDVPLVVTAVDQTRRRTVLLRSRGLAGDRADHVSLLDAALATSAAPTFFPPHRIGDTTYVDGGLTANAPDLVALGDAIELCGARPEDIHMLSIGTAGGRQAGGSIRFGGRLPWILSHDLVPLVIAAQEDAAIAQARRILGDRFFRVDAEPVAAIRLDDVARLGDLDRLAVQAVTAAQGDRRWPMFAGRKARRVIESDG